MTKKKTLLQRLHVNKRKYDKLDELERKTSDEMRDLVTITNELAESPEVFERIKKLTWRLRRPNSQPVSQYRAADFELATTVNCKAAEELWEMLVTGAAFGSGRWVYLTADFRGIQLQIQDENDHTVRVTLCAKGMVRGRKEILIRQNNMGLPEEMIDPVCRLLGARVTVTAAVRTLAEDAVRVRKAAVEGAQRAYEEALIALKRIKVGTKKK